MTVCRGKLLCDRVVRIVIRGVKLPQEGVRRVVVKQVVVVLEAENSINRKIEVMLFSGKNLELTEIFSLSSAQIQNEITKVTFFCQICILSILCLFRPK